MASRIMILRTDKRSQPARRGPKLYMTSRVRVVSEDLPYAACTLLNGCTMQYMYIIPAVVVRCQTEQTPSLFLVKTLIRQGQL